MPADTGSTTRVQVLLRSVDEEVLAAAAKSRHQCLSQFLAEVLTVTAADLRQPPRAAVSWLDCYSRHGEPAVEDDDDIYYTMPRPPRRVYLPTGPTPGKR